MARQRVPRSRQSGLKNAMATEVSGDGSGSKSAASATIQRKVRTVDKNKTKDGPGSRPGESGKVFHALQMHERPRNVPQVGFLAPRHVLGSAFRQALCVQLPALENPQPVLVLEARVGQHLAWIVEVSCGLHDQFIDMRVHALFLAHIVSQQRQPVTWSSGKESAENQRLGGSSRQQPHTIACGLARSVARQAGVSDPAIHCDRVAHDIVASF